MCRPPQMRIQSASGPVNQSGEKMTMPTQDEIAHFTRIQYDYWNEGKWQELADAYALVAPNGYTIQYYGKEPVDGRLVLDTMIKRLGGKVRTVVQKVLVNEGEAVAIISNEVVGTDVASTTMERYLFADGRLACSYFHDAEEGERMTQALSKLV
jgi:hypothetical protein